ncbi:hypothetical protein ABKW28_15990 [Nocardioides sp. 31GB23]|uniref:hypothetical protein n=1 Tax=Nocardioides sp. 31GB23 TaxID=3156065 RepID=UPI0032AF23E7
MSRIVEWSTGGTLPRMVDIATVSVVSSAALAGLTIAANVYGGERQRRHEADLDFEKRVWERKSEALFEVIRQCRTLADSDAPVDDTNRLAYALDMSKMLDTLHDNLSTVEAFASSKCREGLTDLIEALRNGGVKHRHGRDVDHWRGLAADTSIEETQGRWLYYSWRKQSEAKAVADFDPDLDDLRARAEHLLEAARESVRRAKD